MPLKRRQVFSLSHLPVELHADSCVYGVYLSVRHPDQHYTQFFHPCFPKTSHSCENPGLFSHKIYIYIYHQIWDESLRRYLISKPTKSQLSPHTTAVCHGFVLQLPFSSVRYFVAMSLHIMSGSY